MSDGRVDVGNARDPLIDQVERLAPQRGLQAIGDVALDLPLDMDRLLADGGVEGERLLDGLRRGVFSAYHFDQRDQVRRVEGMAQDDAAGVPGGVLDVRNENAGGRRWR